MALNREGGSNVFFFVRRDPSVVFLVNHRDACDFGGERVGHAVLPRCHRVPSRRRGSRRRGWRIPWRGRGCWSSSRIDDNRSVRGVLFGVHTRRCQKNRLSVNQGSRGNLPSPRPPPRHLDPVGVGHRGVHVAVVRLHARPEVCVVVSCRVSAPDAVTRRRALVRPPGEAEEVFGRRKEAIAEGATLKGVEQRQELVALEPLAHACRVHGQHVVPDGREVREEPLPFHERKPRRVVVHGAEKGVVVGADGHNAREVALGGQATDHRVVEVTAIGDRTRHGVLLLRGDLGGPPDRGPGLGCADLQRLVARRRRMGHHGTLSRRVRFGRQPQHVVCDASSGHPAHPWFSRGRGSHCDAQAQAAHSHDARDPVTRGHVRSDDGVGLPKRGQRLGETSVQGRFVDRRAPPCPKLFQLAHLCVYEEQREGGPVGGHHLLDADGWRHHSEGRGREAGQGVRGKDGMAGDALGDRQRQRGGRHAPCEAGRDAQLRRERDAPAPHALRVEGPGPDAQGAQEPRGVHDQHARDDEEQQGAVALAVSVGVDAEGGDHAGDDGRHHQALYALGLGRCADALHGIDRFADATQSRCRCSR